MFPFLKTKNNPKPSMLSVFVPISMSISVCNDFVLFVWDFKVTNESNYIRSICFCLPNTFFCQKTIQSYLFKSSNSISSNVFLNKMHALSQIHSQFSFWLQQVSKIDTQKCKESTRFRFYISFEFICFMLTFAQWLNFLSSHIGKLTNTYVFTTKSVHKTKPCFFRLPRLRAKINVLWQH